MDLVSKNVRKWDKQVDICWKDSVIAATLKQSDYLPAHEYKNLTCRLQYKSETLITWCLLFCCHTYNTRSPHTLPMRCHLLIFVPFEKECAMDLLLRLVVSLSLNTLLQCSPALGMVWAVIESRLACDPMSSVAGVCNQTCGVHLCSAYHVPHFTGIICSSDHQAVCCHRWQSSWLLVDVTPLLADVGACSTFYSPISLLHQKHQQWECLYMLCPDEFLSGHWFVCFHIMQLG